MAFDVGARVRTREPRPVGHTRLPRYLARRNGRIVRALGAFRFADDGAQVGPRASEQMLYTVEFDTGSHTVCADLFESYLEAEP
ncbi:MAG TPA: SH3-like domain-containing protein [Candidatus Baltobacteraceae bacterium]|jgi:hypothetical protein|nr:SH3-like domain-containing protein [Candidatus Baltobacteraceae bacterium]